MSEMNQNEGIEEPSVGDATGVTQYRVSFPEAIRRFCTTYTSNGRASRSEYWWSLLFCFVLILGVSAIFGEDGIATNIISLIVKIMGILIGWRRIHDIGKSGWWFLVPVYNIWLLVQPSQLQENKFGKVPNTTPSGKNMVWNRVSWTIIGVSLVAFLFLGDGDSSEGSGSSQATRFDIKKMRDSDELWFEGTNKITETKGDLRSGLDIEESCIKVEPNLMIIPDGNILPLGMGRTSPEKSINYIYDGGDGISGHRWTVEFVDDGYVVVRNVGSFSGEETYFHIETQDEYIDGQNLKPGFYIYRGREKVSLVNGSSVTMYSFKKRTDGFFEAVCAAVEYNEKATEAANDENRRRESMLYEKVEKRYEEEQPKAMKAKCGEAIIKLNPAFIAKAKEYIEILLSDKRVHITPSARGKVKISDILWPYYELDYTFIRREPEFVRPKVRFPETIDELEKQGCLICFGGKMPETFGKRDGTDFDNAIRELGYKTPESVVEGLFEHVGYDVMVPENMNGCRIFVLAVRDNNSPILMELGWYAQRTHELLCPWEGYKRHYYREKILHVYVLDIKRDADIVDMVSRVDRDIIRIKNFMQAFRDKYEPGAKIEGIDGIE